MITETRMPLGRMLLVISLLAGTGVNLWGAYGFIADPLGQATKLGLPLVSDLGSAAERASVAAQSGIVFLRLSSAMLIVLATFYALTACYVFTSQDAARYADLVGFAIFARLAGVLFYAVTIFPNGEPSSFIPLLGVNLVLAMLHGAFLGKDGWRQLLRIQGTNRED